MKKSLLSLAVITALSSSLIASDVRVSGFMNVVGGANDIESDNISSEYKGYGDRYSFMPDSVAAIQFGTNISDKMGATIQIIAQNSKVGDNIRMEWGYISYDATDEIRILAGKVRPALFLYSDYLDVGYAYSWITPPSEVYDQAQITKLAGATASYTAELDDSQIVFNMYGGNAQSEKLQDGNIIKFQNDSILGAALSWSDDNMKFRVGYTRATITAPQTYAVTDPAKPVLVVENLAFKDSDAAFYGVGFNVDYEGLLVSAEYIVRDMDETVAPDVNAYYAMVGYKMGDFTPTYTYAAAESDLEEAKTTNPTFNGMINTMRTEQLDNRYSHTIGIRYDINPQAAFKLEYNVATLTHSTYEAGKIAEVDEDINTYRVALNVVF